MRFAELKLLVPIRRSFGCAVAAIAPLDGVRLVPVPPLTDWSTARTFCVHAAAICRNVCALDSVSVMMSPATSCVVTGARTIAL